MKIGIPREIFEDERRVAATPPSVHKLISLGYEVMIEGGAGEAANYTDDAYEKVGATIAADTKALWQEADVVLKVRAPMKNPSLNAHEVDLMKEGAFLVSYLWPAQNPELLEKLAAKKITSFAIDSLPRISRAQKMDALSAMANIAGYRAVIEAANNFGRFFTGQMTAAGKVPPAKIMVIGAGVAGLAAIGAANSMGAIVRAFDTRLEVKEQVESMGAEFLVLDFDDEDGSGSGGYAKQMSDEFIKVEMALFAEQAKVVDIIITTALIPGKPAPGTEEPSAEQKAAALKQSERRSMIGKVALLLVTLAALYGVGAHAPESFLSHFTVFVLACFIGWQVIWNVTPSLHTPLMSVTNAISGIIVIGAMLHLAQAENIAVGIMAFVAVLIASVNVGGGFRVTHRMLNMFRK